MRTSFNRPTAARIQRVVVFLRLPSADATREDVERYELALRRFQGLQAQVDATLKRLHRLWERPLAPISIQLDNRLSGSLNLNAHILAAPQGVRSTPVPLSTRPLVSLIPVTDRRSSGRISIPQSHLVAVIVDGQREDISWRAAIGVSSAVVEASLENYTQVLEDVFLDIVMFNSFPEFAAAFPTPSQRQEFSRRKVAFLHSLKAQLPLSLAETASLSYVSFATAARDGEKLDLDRYVQLWENFTQALGVVEFPTSGAFRSAGTTSREQSAFARAPNASGTTPAVSDELTNSIETPTPESSRRACEYILKNHRKGAQISRKHLARVVNKLGYGFYVLLRSESKPRRRVDQVKVNSIFGARRWRTGRLQVVSVDQADFYSRYRRYISLIRFTVEPKQNPLI